MRLDELFADAGIEAPALPINDLSSNSRDVRPGGLFLACAGTRGHGLDYLDAAVDAGAAAVAWEPAPGIIAPKIPAAVIEFAVPALSRMLGRLADRFFAAPSTQLTVTGITGTNGKTTVAYLVNQALNHLGQPSAYSGTLGWGLGDDLQPSALTTPGCVELHRRLRILCDAGARHVITEASSHGLDQGRTDGIRFAVAALTNLSHDHLDYHGSMEAYAAAKSRLFTETPIGTAVINVADHFGAGLAGRLRNDIELLSVALVELSGPAPDARLLGQLSAADAQGLGLQLSGDFGEAMLRSPLWGRFNAQNLVCAAGILVALGITLGDAAEALAECVAPPGRMQLVAPQRQPSVVVDFAHTPEALAAALEATRAHARGKVWCVFGCGGERDKGKRPRMGAVAARLADRVIVTDDNPRGENPADIIAAIVGGIDDTDKLDVVPDRAAAIDLAVEAADAADAVLIAGKGHEAVQIYGAQARPFSDVDVAAAALGARA